MSDAKKALGIIAGAGSLPADLVEACLQQGRPVFVVALDGFADHARLFDVPHIRLAMSKAGAIMQALAAHDVGDVVLVGRVKRPPLSSIVPDKEGAAIVGRLIGKLREGDDALLRAVGAEFEQAGFRLVGVRDVLADLLTPPGAAGCIAPTDIDHADIVLGNQVAKTLGELDVGQGAVVQHGLVLAVEAIEGTDAMLSRVAAVHQADQTAKGVLVKARKPQQSDKIDLPVIGPETVKRAAKAGLGGIAYEAGQTLIAEKTDTIKLADDHGLFLYGYDSATLPVSAQSPKIMIVAGEASGDLLGQRVMQALQRQTGHKVTFIGIGGPRMTEAGLDSLFPMTELSIMGLTEVMPRLRGLIQRMKEAVALAEREKPDLVLTIDSPGFTWRLAKKLKHLSIPRVHLVAPTVWAWKEKRAKHCADVFDHMLTLLPFEPPYFEKEGLASTFVGHPVLEGDIANGDGPAFRARHGIGADEKVLLVLPGSRAGEVSRLGPVFGETLALLQQRIGAFRVVTPVVPQISDLVQQVTGDWPVDVLTIAGDEEKFDAFAGADVALAASGTVSLELAAAGLPQVIGYRLSAITTWLVRKMVKVEWASLVNILGKREIVPEAILEYCNAENLAGHLTRLMQDEDARNQQKAAFNDIIRQLSLDGQTSSDVAAQTILQLLDRR